MRGLLRISWAASLCLALLPAAALAVPIGPGDFSGSETVIDFDTVPAAVPPPGSFSIGGVTFSEFSSGSGAAGWRLLDAAGFLGTTGRFLTDNAGISLIQIDFATPVLRAGLVVGVTASYDVNFYDQELALVDSIAVSPVNPLGLFAGSEHLAGISRIEIVETSGENSNVGGFDDLRFELVPEPATGLLLGMGLVGLAWRKRRTGSAAVS